MISVCIATYNGEKYVKEQVDSILGQISPTDEVVICDDGSDDRTLSILSGYDDTRVRIHLNERRLGHVKNFEKALTLAQGEYIFLSDQDDVWLPGRVDRMLSVAREDPNVLLVASNFDLIDDGGSVVGIFRKLRISRKSRIIKIFLIFAGRTPYFGCTFLLNKNILGYCLPFPENIESHDIWIALIASCYGKVVNIQEATLQRRIHGENLTAEKRRSLDIVIKSRFDFLISLMRRITKLKFGSVTR